MSVLIHMRITSCCYHKVHSFNFLSDGVCGRGRWRIDLNLCFLKVDIFLWTLAFLLVNLFVTCTWKKYTTLLCEVVVLMWLGRGFLCLRQQDREELRLSRKCKEVICSATNCNSRSFQPHSHLKVKALHMNIQILSKILIVRDLSLFFPMYLPLACRWTDRHRRSPFQFFIHCDAIFRPKYRQTRAKMYWKATVT